MYFYSFAARHYYCHLKSVVHIVSNLIFEWPETKNTYFICLKMLVHLQSFEVLTLSGIISLKFEKENYDFLKRAIRVLSFVSTSKILLH